MPTLADLLKTQRPSMVGMVGNSQPIRTFANTIQGYTPPQMTAFTNPQVMDYAKGVGQSAQQNLQTQISDLNKALVMGDKGVEIGDKIALTRLLDQIPGLMGAVAYHGTPHTIRGKFDISKVGTGEGAQAYGHGIYFAENPAVATEYKNILGSRIDVNGKPLYNANKTIGSTGNTELDDYLVANLGDVKATRKQLLNDIREIRPTNPEAAKEMQNTLADLRKANVGVQNTGNLYKVDIPDEYIPKMVQWETPLSEMDEKLASVIKPLQEQLKNQPNPDLFKNVKSVGDVIQYSNAIGLKPHIPLQEAGYKGIRYLDEGSRSSGKGTSNFVVFDPSEVKILEKNNKPYDPLEAFIKGFSD